MKKRILTVEFDRSWLLEHRADYDLLPAEYFAQQLNSQSEKFSATVTSLLSCEVLCDAEQFTSGEAKSLVESYLMRIFMLEEIDEAATVTVKDAILDTEAVDNGEDDDSNAELDALFSDLADLFDSNDDDEDGEDDDIDPYEDEGFPPDEDTDQPPQTPSVTLEQIQAARKELEERKRQLEEMRGRAQSGENKQQGANAPQTPTAGRNVMQSAQSYKANSKLVKIINSIDAMRESLSEKVKGQAHAIEAFVNTIFGMKVRMANGEKTDTPRALFLFAGPPGVGKTYLAEQAAKELNLPFLRLDMSGFSDGDVSVENFRGINPSYKKAAAGQVTSFVEEHPHCVLLFDEIEKAHISVIQLFLQILEGGRCHDSFTDKDVDFTETVIIMTTNAGKNLYDDFSRTNLSDVTDKMVINALKKDIDPVKGTPLFPAPIISRLATGTIVMFNRLEPFALAQIVGMEIEKQLCVYRNAFKFKVNCGRDIYDAMLYSEGGNADARTLKGNAKSMIQNEMLSLMNQLKYTGGEEAIGKLEEISFNLDIEGASEEARSLFVHTRKPQIVTFCNGATASLIPAETQDICKLVTTDKLSKAKNLLRGNIAGIIIDVTCGCREKSYSPSDLEDISSDGIDLFRYVREFYPDLPVYMLETEGIGGGRHFHSFIAAGARDSVPLKKGREKEFSEGVQSMCSNARMCNEANRLARMNKVLSYNCAQVISEDGASAEIKLASLCIKRSVEAEDSEAILGNASKPNTTFKDVIGAADAKQTLQDFIEYLKNPRDYQAKGVRVPRGVLLYGPPGTGKTLLAKAMAGESDVAFIQKNGTEFFKSLVGQGPAAIREAFRLARKYAPCILFIDEIDTIGKMRTGSETMHTMEELQNTFLSEMDGFTHDDLRPVFVLAATNYEIDENSGTRRVLDPAFVRRFDRKIRIELPNTEERKQFINYYLEKHGIKHIKGETVESLAIRSIGRSPADLEMVVEFAIRMMKGKKLTDEVLTKALDADKFGEEKTWKEETVRKTSHHEAGHAVISWLTGKTPAYLTNISRGHYGGYMLPEIDDEKSEYNRDELLDEICCDLGGRAAEIVFYGEKAGITTGASSDLHAATRTAWSIIARYGMGKRLMTLDNEAMYGEGSQILHAEISEILDNQLARAIKLIQNNKPMIEALVDALMKRNSLTGKEISEILKDIPKNGI